MNLLIDPANDLINLLESTLVGVWQSLSGMSLNCFLRFNLSQSFIKVVYARSRMKLRNNNSREKFGPSDVYYYIYTSIILTFFFAESLHNVGSISK